MNDKVFLSLVSVVVGWLLAQVTNLVKDFLAARKLRKGLMTELEDIQDQLQRVLMIHERQLQIFANKGMEPTAALPIQNMFFKQYFKDAFPYLSREQRISYQLIHATLDELNKKNLDLTKYFEESYKELRISPEEKKALEIINFWGERVIVIYKTAQTIRWYIAYHLKHPKAPHFDIMGPMHESYVKFEHDLDQAVRSVLEQAKDIKKEDFERIYDPVAFAHNRK